MAAFVDDPLVPLGAAAGLFLVVVALGTLITAPWQYHGSTTVSVLRITGSVATLLLGVGLVYVAWGADWLDARRT